MNTLGTITIILCSIGAGWFIRTALDTAIERINDWRVPAWWAAFAIFDIIGVMLCARYGIIFG
jgi:hypothetical protein